MCTFENGFKLCTCEEQSQGYDWILSRFLGEAETHERGRYLMPDEDIGEGLTAAVVEVALNQTDTKVFDFDYEPSEGDNLVVKRRNDGRYLSFIHREGRWVEDHYFFFTTRVEEMFSGQVAPS